MRSKTFIPDPTVITVEQIVPDAIQYLKEGRAQGKVVISMSPPSTDAVGPASTLNADRNI